MQKIVMFFKRSLICFILSFSLLCNNTAAVTYQAAAIPVTYAAWEVFVTIFALLGITLASAHDNAAAKQEDAKDLADKFAGWKVLQGEGLGDNNNDGEDDLYAAFDVTDYIDDDGHLVLPEEDLEDFKQFYQDNMAKPLNIHAMNNVDVSKMNYQEFSDWFYPYFNLESRKNDSYANKFVAGLFDTLPLHDYFGVLWYNSSYGYYFYDPLDNISNDDFSLGWREKSNGGSNYVFYKINDTSSYKFGFSNPAVLGPDFSKNYGSSHNWDLVLESPSCRILAIFINGCLYDPALFTYPVNSTTSLDYGTLYHISDFVKSTNNISSNFTDIPNSINGLDLSDMIYNNTYDVIGNGREYDSEKKDVVGDLKLPMPSQDTITDYENGNITYEDFLEDLEVTPIDKNEGVNLFTQEFLDKQIEISNGITSLNQLTQQVVDWLSDFFNNIGNMLVRLFVPADGYFESYFTRMNDFFDSRLGFLYTPFDLLIRFLSALPSVDHSSTQLYFPGLKFQEYVLCEPMYVELNLRDEFPALYRYMYFITDTILIGAVLWLLQSKTKELIKG